MDHVLSTDQWLRRIQHINVFPRYSRKYAEAQRRTACGAGLTVFSILVVLGLVLSELSFYRSVETITKVEVDDEVHGTIPVYVNVTFPNANCAEFELEVVDVAGKATHTDGMVQKRMLSAATVEPATAQKMEPEKTEHCPSCYGAEDNLVRCCPMCSDIIAAYNRRGWRVDSLTKFEQCSSTSGISQGCNVQGRIMLNRVQGNMHFLNGMGITFGGQHVHDVSNALPFDSTHEIHSLGFGEEINAFVNPLDGRVSKNGPGLYRYFVIIVPTKFEDINGTTHYTYQYSLTTHFKPKSEHHPLSGIYIIYDLAPIQVHVTQRGPYKSFLHFLLYLCAVAGGVYTVIALVDSVVFHSVRRIEEKLRMGKQT